MVYMIKLKDYLWLSVSEMSKHFFILFISFILLQANTDQTYVHPRDYQCMIINNKNELSCYCVTSCRNCTINNYSYTCPVYELNQKCKITSIDDQQYSVFWGCFCPMQQWPSCMLNHRIFIQ